MPVKKQTKVTINPTVYKAIQLLNAAKDKASAEKAVQYFWNIDQEIYSELVTLAT